MSTARTTRTTHSPRWKRSSAAVSDMLTRLTGPTVANATAEAQELEKALGRLQTPLEELAKRLAARLDNEAAEHALETISEDSERAAAIELVERKLRGRPAPSGDDPESRAERDKVVRRLAGMLARKGYAPGMALGVVKDVLGGLDLDD